MNDPKEIANAILFASHKHSDGGLAGAIAAAIQAERAAGAEWMALDRGKQLLEIDRLKTELERVKAERDQLKLDLDRASSMASQNRLTAEHLLAERDEAVKHVKVLLHHFGHPKIEEWMNRQAFETALDADTAARAFVEKVKPHHTLDIRNPLPYNTPDEQPQAGEAEHEAET